MESCCLPQFGAQLIWEPTPNCGPRKDGLVPDLIVLHYTAMADTGAVIRHLCDSASQVSAHYVIDPFGEVTEMVPEPLRAWHAGAASWGGEADVNSRSIGIELVNDGFQPFPNPQMSALEGLLGALMARWDIAPSGVVAHSDVAPGRKIDPGSRFDWRRLALQGLAVWPTPTPPTAASDFRADLGQAGYSADVSVDVLLSAMRLRFRPWAHGALDDEDRAIAAGLATQFPAQPARRG